MSKRAEKAAIKAYPNVEQPVWDKSYPKTLFVRHTERNAFIKGYEQAEKDLALTWEDVKKIEDLCMEVTTLFASVGRNKVILEPPFYEEVARRFNEIKKK